MIRPGEEVHWVALLDREGNTLVTVALDPPLECPQRAEDVKVNVELNLTLRGRN